MIEHKLEDYLIECVVCGQATTVRGLCIDCELSEEKPKPKKPQEFIKQDGKRRKPKQKRGKK